MNTVLEFGRGDNFAVGLCGDTVVLYYDRSPTMATAPAIDMAICQAAARRERVNLLVVIAAGAGGVPEPAVRESMMNSMKRSAHKTSALSYAILGDGFTGAAVRAVVSGMLLLLRLPYPAKVFSTVDAAVFWLRSQMNERQRKDLSIRADTLERFCSTAPPPLELR